MYPRVLGIVSDDLKALQYGFFDSKLSKRWKKTTRGTIHDVAVVLSDSELLRRRTFAAEPVGSAKTDGESD